MDGRTEPHRILVVDDDGGLRALIQRRLEREGHCAVGLDTGAAAVEWLGANDAQLMLLDLKLPDMSGDELLRILEQRRRAVPFIVITGQGDERVAVRMMKQGARDYLMKDGAFLELLPSVVSRVLEQSDRERRLINTEQSLRESQRTLSTLMSNLPGMAYRCRNDEQWTMEFVSEGCLELTGYPCDALINNRRVSYANVICPDDRAAVWSEVQDAVGKHQPFRMTYRITTASGEEKWVWEQGRAVYGPEGQVTALEGFICDITERKLAEEQLRHSQKMEAVGRLASGVAHDFNNLLTAIFGYNALARKTLPPDHPGHQFLGLADQAIQQASGVTKSLLTFGHKMPAEKSPLDVGQVVVDSLRLLRRLLPASIEIVEDVPPGLNLWVDADATQLQQVLINLAVNARDAMPDGGQLRIRLGPSEDPPRASRPDAVVTVEDTGVGMSEEVRSRIFEPFFTTKRRGEGTGLGMSIVHGIVTEHGGRIVVESEPGRGTRVSITLPTCERPGAVPAPTAPAGGKAGQGELILVAEDDEHIRSIVTSALRSEGYEVVQVADGVEALQALDDYDTEVRLLLLDVDLPRLDGLSCLRQARERRADIPAMLVTGSMDMAGGGKAVENVQVLRKPFRMSDLTAAVAQTLAKAGSEAKEALR